MYANIFYIPYHTIQISQKVTVKMKGPKQYPHHFWNNPVHLQTQYFENRVISLIDFSC